MKGSTPVSRRPGSWSSNKGQAWSPRGALPSRVLQTHPGHREGVSGDLLPRQLLTQGPAAPQWPLTRGRCR